MATRLDQAEQERAQLRRDVAKIRGRLASVKAKLSPLRTAHYNYLRSLWSECWVAFSTDGQQTSDPETAARWQAQKIAAGAIWRSLGRDAYAEKDAVLAQFQHDIRPHLDAERALKIELEIAERDLAAAERLVARLKGNSTEGSKQHVLDWA